MGNNWEVIGWRCKRDNIFKNWLGRERFRLIVGSHFQRLIVLGWMGDAEMWELTIMCSNWGWMCQTQKCSRIGLGEGG